MISASYVVISAVLVTFCSSYSPTLSDASSNGLYKIGRGSMASIFNAAYYMTIERMKIPASEASLSSPVFNMMYLRELDRLKENYTKDESVHQVVVAKSLEDEVIGYIDIDRRNIFNKRFPTPYISDLVVQPAWRNKGVATSLLAYCTDVVCKVEWMESYIHLLVESDNRKALNLYSKMEFIPLQAETGDMDDLSQIKIIPINSSAFEIADAISYSALSAKPIMSGDSLKLTQQLTDIDSNLGRSIIDLDSLLKGDAILSYDRVLLRKLII